MQPRTPPAPDPSLQATLRRAPTGECQLWLWGRDGRDPSPLAEPFAVQLGDERIESKGELLTGDMLLDVAKWPVDRASPSVAGVVRLAKLAQQLVQRRAVRPAFLDRGS